MKTREIYIHIPFCVKKCNYCDFLSFKYNEDIKDKYIDCLCNEIRHSDMEEVEILTIFIGGGTPSVLEESDIEKIMITIKSHCLLSDDVEITIEVNPGTVTESKAHLYKSIGINRVSIGMQSADDWILKKLGRIHNTHQFFECYERLRKVGINNINVDVMSGLPGLTLENYEDTLKRVCELGPEHISAYSLIIEENTPFFELYNSENGKYINELPDEENERRQYERTDEILKLHGYYRYEISNYAKEGYECRHNSGYWTGVPYYGFGLGASSFIDDTRFCNVSSMEDYIKNKGLAESKDSIILLSKKEKMEEFMYLGLRMTKGISINKFKKIFDEDIYTVFGKTIDKYLSMNLLVCEGDRIFLSNRGIDISNYIFSDFLM